MSGRFKKTVIGSLVSISILVGCFMSASPVGASTSGPCNSDPSRTCRPRMSTDWVPWDSPTNRGSANQWTIHKGTRVNMVCWSTGARRLNTRKWFRVESTKYPYPEGFVPANAVTQQIRVRHC